jgi:hypothetical protein
MLSCLLSALSSLEVIISPHWSIGMPCMENPDEVEPDLDNTDRRQKDFALAQKEDNLLENREAGADGRD